MSLDGDAGAGTITQPTEGSPPVGLTLEAVGLVRQQEHVLLELDGRTRRWRLPTAPVDGPETAAETLCWRVRATLGVEATAAAFLGVCHCPTAHGLGLVFQLELPDRLHPAPVTDEVLHAAWFRPADLPAEIAPRSRLVIQASVDDRALPFILTHQDDFGVVEPRGLVLPPPR